MVTSELHKLVKQPETPPVVISVQTEPTDLQCDAAETLQMKSVLQVGPLEEQKEVR